MGKLRAMHVISSRKMGGTERMLTHLIPNFDTENFESCLVCFNSPSLLTTEWQDAGIKVFHLYSDKPISLIGIYRFLKLLRKWKPDILFVYGLRANLMARLAACFHRVKVFIASQQGIEDWKSKLAIFLEKSTSIFVDKYIGVSQACCDMLAKREKISKRKLEIVHNGICLITPRNIDQKVREIKEKYSYPQNSFVIGSVGRLNPIKGHEYLVEAAESILKDYPNSFYVILGDDQRNGELHQLIKKKSLENKIILPGFSKDVTLWLATFDIFVLPSLSEGLPVVVLEALLMKKPVVATDVGGTGEVVINNKTGLLVKPANSQALSEAIKILIKDSNLRRELSENGYEYACKNFTIENMVKKYENIAIDIFNRK